jgi:hypothetical protein
MMGHVAIMWERSGVCRVIVGKPEGKRLLGNPGLEGRIKLKWIFGKWDGDMGWIDLAQNRDRWRALVNALMNLRVP